MLVYGDAVRTEGAREKLSRLDGTLRDLEAVPAGLARHGALVAALIEAGELAQGLADHAFSARGRDGPSPAADAAMALLMRVAEAVRTSWSLGLAGPPFHPGVEIDALAALTLPDALRSKRAEGFAYYALYPEAYLRAAEALRPGPSPRVIGLRSIGTTLGAVVAAALGAPPPLTLRPFGHPFRRELALTRDAETSLLADPAGRFAVVDEGPGLSGSSFNAVVDLLEARGVPPGRVHLFPGHAGAPGHAADPRHRDRWPRLHRHPADFEATLLRAERPEHRLLDWAAALLGPAAGPLEDISGGRWRRLRAPDAASWPPVHPFMERRKFLFRAAAGDAWLLRFVGLGRHGQEQLGRARALHARNLVPEPAGFLHGFLAERWIGDALPIPRPGAGPLPGDRAGLAEHLGHYLSARAHALPAGPERGASARALWEMARHNAAEALGEEPASRLDRWKPCLATIEARMHRHWTDNRLHAWEWLRRPDGQLLKADAVDHAAAHDLVGCQDVAWDLAGASVELGLSPDERDTVCRIVQRGTNRCIHPDVAAFLLHCYLAFQLGSYTMAAEASTDPDDAARARVAAGRYAGLLGAELAGDSSGLPRS